MKVINCTQGGPEWHMARAGVITASMFKCARSRVGGLDAKQQCYVNAILAGALEKEARDLAGYKLGPTSDTVRRAIAGEKVGDWSEAAKDYAFRVAIERISGEPLDEGFETWQMNRGHEMEPAARMEHESQTGLVITHAGFITSDDGLFGGSADGLISDDGGSEYKCLVSPSQLREVLLANDLSEFTDQIQGCLWLSGRKFWHFCLYCPALAPVGKQLYFREILRDEAYIESMEADLMRFAALVDEFQQTLLRKAA